MANRRLLAVLREQGPEVWNSLFEQVKKDWRGRIDLRGAVLRDAKLSGARLSNADLSYSDLSHADLSSADLRNANLGSTNLRSADLSDTDFRGADLRSADLRNANFKGADLTGARLTGADLAGVDFSAFRFDRDPSDDIGLQFLSLALSKNLNEAQFGDDIFLSSYLEKAFTLAHDVMKQPEPMPFSGSSPEDCGVMSVYSIRARFAAESIRKFQTLRALSELGEASPSVIYALDTLTIELIDYLKRHPKQLYGIPPRIFEEIVAEVLASFGWQVNLTAKSKDGGYDIFALSPNGKAGVETSWLVECKRYAPGRPVGVNIVRELYGSNAFRPQAAAMKMLATTSYFTKGVHAMKASTYDLALKDYAGILDWLNSYRPNPDGRLYLDTGGRLVVPGKK